MKNLYPFKLLGIVFVILVLFRNQLPGQIERFLPRQGGSTEIWRITNNSSLRNWANYHNTDAWSPDGRYICYEKYEPYDLNAEIKVYIYDLYLAKETDLGRGKQARWATNHNWLFYILEAPADGPSNGKGTRVMWLDVDNNKLNFLTYGVPNLGETDYADRWIYGFTGRDEFLPRINLTPYDRDRVAFRIPIRPDSRRELIENNPGFFWIPNPAHPVIQVRLNDDRARPFTPTRTYCDLDGEIITNGSPQIQRCHQSWSGDGEYLLHGGTSGTLMCGRKWDEPFPSNLHTLSAIHCGDISACGKSGRWVCGGENDAPLQLADLWSGDGWDYLQSALSYIHDSYIFSYNQGSALNDNDSKGSADGTKIVFASNYDLKDGPVTEIKEDAETTTDKIIVKSTEGFPASGTLSVGNEVVGYKRKTSASFEGLTRNLYNTTGQNLDGVGARVIQAFIDRKSDEEFLKGYPYSSFIKAKALIDKIPARIRKGEIITSFDSRLIPENLRKNMKFPAYFASAEFRDDKNSPLLWQRRTDVYVAVVRLPDQPHFNKAGTVLELIPGENHWETFGYYIFKEGKKITEKPLRPGETFILPSSGAYTAVAVEWSGLESKKSFPFKADGAEKLNIRFDKPADFSWTSERWLIEGKEVSKEDALSSREAVKEIVHLIEGVIHREWYTWGQIETRHDLRADGKAVRRLTYKNGKLSKREYYDKGTELTSCELFDENGNYIIESMQYRTVDGKPEEVHHFWYENGYPVRFAGSGGRHAADEGPGLYEKEAENWVKLKAF